MVEEQVEALKNAPVSDETMQAELDATCQRAA